jgi:hypothetical protein
MKDVDRQSHPHHCAYFTQAEQRTSKNLNTDPEKNYSSMKK